MTYNLFNLTYYTARELQQVIEGTATGGSTTTIVDASGRLTQYGDDYFNLNDVGTAWLLRDSAGASAAPEGEYALVSDFVSSTGTATVATFTIAVASGDSYGIANDKFPLTTIIQHINMALMELPWITKTDTTSVRIAAAKTEYSLPTGLAGGQLREVWIQGQTSDANDNRWQRVYNWYIQRSDTGTADLLIMPYQYATDYYCKLVYMAPHADLRVYTDKLDEDIPLSRIVYPSALSLAWWAKERFKTDEYDSMIVRLEAATERAKNSYRIESPQPQRKSRKILTEHSYLTMDESDPGTVYIR